MVKTTTTDHKENTTRCLAPMAQW